MGCIKNTFFFIMNGCNKLPDNHLKCNILQGILKGGVYHCTVDLLFDWFGLAYFANKNNNCQLLYSLFQTSQTGGQRYIDASPFRIPCTLDLWAHL